MTEKSLVLFCYIQDWWHKSERGRMRWKNFLLSKLFLKRVVVTKKNLERKKGGLRLFIWFDLFRSTKYTRGPSVLRGTYVCIMYDNKIVALWKYVRRYSIYSSFWPFRVNIGAKGFLWHFLMMKFWVSYSLQGA